MIIDGKIVKFVLSRKKVSILQKNVIYNIRLSNSQVKQFSRYFLINSLLKIEVNQEYVATKVIRVSLDSEIVYYDEAEIKKGVKKLFEIKTNKLFLDLELSMHPYHKENNFVQEIIQVGYYLEDETGKLIKKDSFYVKSVKHNKLTDRTLKFLNITQEHVTNGLKVEEFYEYFKNLINEYKPKIYVWGRNDFLSLDLFYKMHNFTSVTNRSDFVNLLQVYKTYKGLKNDIGLYNCYLTYENKEEVQMHDALEDSRITREIFHFFKNEVMSDI